MTDLATHLDGSAGNYATRTTSAPTRNSGFTWATWVYVTLPASGNNDTAVFDLYSSGDSAREIFRVIVSSIGANGWYYYTSSHDHDLTYTGPEIGSPLTGEWFYFAITISGTSSPYTISMYLAKEGDTLALVASTSAETLSYTPAGFQVGHRYNNTSSFYSPIDVYAMRVWQAEALTLSQLQAEMASTVAVYKTGLWADWKFNSTSLADSSGNGNNLTAVGTLTNGHTAPISAATTTRRRRLHY